MNEPILTLKKVIGTPGKFYINSDSLNLALTEPCEFVPRLQADLRPEDSIYHRVKYHKNISINRSKFSGFRLPDGATFTHAFKECTFENCIFEYCSFRILTFVKCCFKNVKFYRCDFQYGYLPETKFYNCTGLPLHKDAESNLKTLALEFVSGQKLIWMKTWHSKVKDLRPYSDLSKKDKARVYKLKADHLCGSTHCIAGAAIVITDENTKSRLGARLVRAFDYPIAGLILLGQEAHSHFWDTNEEALKWLKEVAAR
jgi:hypothetical protein